MYEKFGRLQIFSRVCIELSVSPETQEEVTFRRNVGENNVRSHKKCKKYIVYFLVPYITSMRQYQLDITRCSRLEQLIRANVRRTAGQVIVEGNNDVVCASCLFD